MHHPAPDSSRTGRAAGLGRRLFTLTWAIPLAVSAAVDQPKERDDLVALAPFEVNAQKDTGYTAADTISAGRLSTNLLMTPSDTTALTRDFLNDVGAFNMVEASSWLTNAIEVDQGAQSSTSGNIDPRDSGNNTTLRGQATQASTRNYFPSSTTPGEFNVERIEGQAGPNAILYGVGGPGGQVNYITKRAQGYDFVRIRGRADSYGTTYGSIDLNQRLTPTLDARYNGFWQRGKTWQDSVRDNGRGSALSVVYRPWKNTKLSLDGDVGNSYRSWRIDNYSDQSSSWNGVGATGPLTATQAAAAGMQVMGGTQQHFWVWIDGLGLMDWKGYGQSLGSGLNLYPAGVPDNRVFAASPTFPKLPHPSFYIAPDQVHVIADTKDFQGAFSKTFDSGLTVEVAAIYATIFQDGAKNSFSPGINGIRTDPNKLLPNGQPNPNYGKQYTQMEYDYNVNGSYRISRAERAAFNYPVKLGRFGVQNVSVIAQHDEARSRQRFNRSFIPPAAPPLISNGNVLYVFRYFDNATPSLPDLGGTTPLARMVQDTDTTANNRNTSVTLGTAGRYFHDRLSLIGGFRRDKYSSHSGAIGTRNAATGEVTSYNDTDLKAWHNSSSAGLVYFPLKTVGAYAHYDEGFAVVSNPNPDINGTYSPTAIVPSRNFSAGVRFNLLNGRVVASAGHYRTNQSGIYNISLSTYNNALKANNVPLLPAGNLLTSNATMADSATTRGLGWEANATVSLWKSFRLLANVALPDVKIVEQAPAFTKWFTAELPTLQRWASDSSLLPTDVRRTTAQAAIDAGQRAVNDATVGRTQNKNYKYRVNVFGNYTVPATWLKGVRLGAGAQFFGRRVIGSPLGSTGYVYDRAYYIATASTGYTFRKSYRDHKYTLDLQMNVVNLFQYDDALFSGTAVYQSVNLYPNYYTIAPPRTVRFTSTLSF